MTSSPRNRFILSATALYTVGALAWIFLSEKLLAVFTDMESILWLSAAKGFFFVIVTAALYFLTLRAVPPETTRGQDTFLGALASGFIPGQRSRWLHYVFAVVITLAMLAVRSGIPISLNQQLMLVLFMLPIILSALFGGLGPGLVATVAAAGGVAFLATTPTHTLRNAAGYELFQWCFLVANGVAVSLLSEMLRRSLAKAQASQRLLDAVVSGTSDAIFVKDLRGRYVLGNTATAGFVGKPLDKILGHDDTALFSEVTARDVMAKDRSVIASGRTETLVERVSTHDGKEMAFLVTKGPMFDDAGRVSGLFGISRDITEREKDHATLQASESAMREAQRLAHVGSWAWDLVTGVHTWSAEVYQIYGRDPGLPPAGYPEVQQYFTPESWKVLSSAAEKGVAQGIPYECDAEVVRPDGSHRWVTARGQATRDPDAKVIELHGTVQDITERKLAALKLQVSEERFQMAIEATSDGMWDWDLRTGVVYRTPNYYAVCGIPAEEDTQDFEFFKRTVHPDDLPHAMAAIEAHRQGKTAGVEYEYRIVMRSGEIKWMRAKGRVVQRDEAGKPVRMIGTLSDLTEKKLIEATLLGREVQLARVIEGSDQGYWDWNVVTNVFVVSPQWEKMLGFEAGEMKVEPESWPDIVHPDDLPVALVSIQRHLSGEAPFHEAEIRCRTKSGDWRWILTRGRVVEWTADGKPLSMAGTHTDITARKAFELAQREQAAVFESSYEGIMVADPDGLILKVNPAFTRITGYSLAEVQGQSPGILSSGRHDEAFYRNMWDSMANHNFWRGEIWNRRKDGEIFPELLSISVVRDPSGNALHYVGVFSDISQFKDHEAELDRIAHYDPLTGTPNRRLLADRLEQAILRSGRNAHTLAVCYLDLDGFKEVNDQHGHAAGDKLLVGVTNSLKHMLRAEDTLARIGGDEFVLLMTDLVSPGECTQVLDRVLQTVKQPIEINGLKVSVSASIGVSLFPQDHVDADTLLRHADQAMYIAKEAGKNRYHLFDPESDRKAQLHRKYVDRLRTALELDEFVLYYQPKVDLLSGEIVGAEALIRWQHPEKGLVSPAEFLPHINGSSLEKSVGEWVINTALNQAEVWHQLGLTVSVSANISAAHLLQPDFHDCLKAAMARHPAVPASLFELEVLETAAIGDIDQAVTILRHCRELGVRFALDDFGTGYSSLTYLRKLPVDTLKIDQSFVRDMLNDPDDLGIVEGVIRLAGAFNRQVIAEGVETLAHGAALVRMGCHLAQGYGIARPMPVEKFVDWCARWRSEAVWLTLGG